MEKEFTPMQELLNELKEASKVGENPFIKTTINLVIDMVEDKIQKEKKVIEKCCIDMVNLSITKMENKDFEKGMEQEFNEYFNNKFSEK